jgi:hypothetical protein
MTSYMEYFGPIRWARLKSEGIESRQPIFVSTTRKCNKLNAEYSKSSTVIKRLSSLRAPVGHKLQIKGNV